MTYRKLPQVGGIYAIRGEGPMADQLIYTRTDDEGMPWGYIYDVENDIRHPETYLDSILKFGYWEPSEEMMEGYDAPKDDVQSIIEAVAASDRPDTFYFLANSEDDDEPIQAVHFLTNKNYYIREYESWLTMTNEEWDLQEDCVDWQIKPELGVEFLKEFDAGDMTVGAGKKYAAPDYWKAPGYVPASENHNQTDLKCHIKINQIHVHEMRNSLEIISSDELSPFAHQSGYLITGRNKWIFLVPSNTSMSTDDYESEFESIVEKLPNSIPEVMSCGEWIDELNEIGAERFKISSQPVEISHDTFDDFLTNFKKNLKAPFGWSEFEGKD